MNTTTNIYMQCIPITKSVSQSDTLAIKSFHGVYSSKELADKAGKDYCDTQCETWGDEDSFHYTVTIKALDDIINGSTSIKTRLTRIKKRVILYEQWYKLT